MPQNLTYEKSTLVYVIGDITQQAITWAHVDPDPHGVTRPQYPSDL